MNRLGHFYWVGLVSLSAALSQACDDSSASNTDDGAAASTTGSAGMGSTPLPGASTGGGGSPAGSTGGGAATSPTGSGTSAQPPGTDDATTPGTDDGAADDSAADDSAADDSAAVLDDGSVDDGAALDDSAATDETAADDGAVTDEAAVDDSAATDETAVDDSAATDETAADDSATDDSAADDGAEADPPPTLIGDVAFSVPSQSFKGTLTVELSSSIAGEIRYTTDGSLPTASSTLYGEALMLDRTTEVRAQVFPSDGIATFVSTALYVARDFDATSDIPILLIDGYTGGKPTDKETMRRAAFMLFEPQDGVASLENLPTVATRSGHRLRGQSSQSHAKTPYRVELWDNQDQDADYPIAGMPAEADWALIHLYVDRSLVRNAFIYDLGREIGLAAPRRAFAEVYINHTAPVVSSSHYEGVYDITETIKNQKDRLNLQQLKEDDVTPDVVSGGFIMSFEYQAVEGESITCSGDDVFSRSAPGSFNPIPVTEGFCWDHLELRDPDPANSEQQAFITQYIQDFHDTLHSEPVGPYGDFIDTASFVDYFLVTELTRNMDAYIRSAYFHKDRDGKLIAGPLWDYDLSMGNGGFFDNLAAAGWQVANRRIVHDWFIVLTRDPAFLALVEARWAELRQGPLSDANIGVRLSALSAPVTAAAAREHTKWSVATVRQQYNVVEILAGDTWQAQVESLRSWLVARASWMDGEAGNAFTVPDYPFVP